MKLNSIFSIALATAISAACSTTKKSTTSAVSTPVAAPATTNTTPAVPELLVRSSTGVYAPGTEELNAIQRKYLNVSIETLNQGYGLYTGVCTGCHKAFPVYNTGEESWPHIIDDMAVRARLTPLEKDAVLKYVLSIKATQPK